MSIAVPETLEETLTPEWLSEALGVEVTAVTPGPVISRVSTNARFRIDRADGSSQQLCLKGYFNEVGRMFRHAGEPEACFYRDLASRTGLRTLRSLFADPVEGVVITEDVVVQGATFLDALSPYTPDQTAQSLEELAKLHASTWSRPELAELPFLASRLESYTQRRGLTEIEGNFAGPIGAGVPEPVRDGKRLYETYQALAPLVEAADPWSVIHGDAHVGNVYLDGERRPSFVDWQLVQRGPWYLDVGYHIASAITVEDRRRSEDDLLRHYLDHLAAGGVDVPSWDEARRGARRGMVHGFYLWAITLKVDPAITTELLTRLGAAVDDHDALAEVPR